MVLDKASLVLDKVLDKARLVLEKASLEVLDKASGRTATWQRRQGLR